MTLVEQPVSDAGEFSIDVGEGWYYNWIGCFRHFEADAKLEIVVWEVQSSKQSTAGRRLVHTTCAYMVRRSEHIASSRAKLQEMKNDCI